MSAAAESNYEPPSSSKTVNEKFQDYLKKKGATTGSKNYINKSVTLPNHTSLPRGVPGQGLGGAIAVFGGIELLRMAVQKTKETYLEKMEELEIGRFAKSAQPKKNTDKPSKPVPPLPPVDLPVSTVPDGENLISVLKGSSNQIAQVAKQVSLTSSSNKSLVEAIDKLTALISMNAEIDIAYREVALEHSLDANSLLSIIADNTASAESRNSNPDKQDTDQAYRDSNLSATLDIVKELKSISGNVKKSENETSLTEKQLEHIEFETTPVQLNNMGDDIPKASPQAMRAIKDAVVAKKNSDENTFEVDDDDILDMFNGMPDISKIFTYDKKSDRLPPQGTQT